MRVRTPWPWLALLVLVGLLVAAPAQAAGKHYNWHSMTLHQRITAQRALVQQDRNAIQAWVLRRHTDPLVAVQPMPHQVWWRQKHLVWTLKELHESLAKQRAVTAYPPHHALWVCIGSYEGSPTSVNPNGHYGLLQMTYNWMKLLPGKASDYPQATQEWAAERAWQANHYSYSFLVGQWFAYDDADGCYHGS